MLRILLPVSAAIAACSPPPEEAPMHSSTSPTTDGPGSQSSGKTMSGPAGNRDHAAHSPVVEAAALGRRTLSTAFVMIGPDRHMTVDMRDGRTLVLRDVVMQPEDYCGTIVAGGKPGTRHCGGYADVVAARPGGAPAGSDRNSPLPDPAVVEQRSVNRP